jgi:hypothetical protein
VRQTFPIFNSKMKPRSYSLGLRSYAAHLHDSNFGSPLTFYTTFYSPRFDPDIRHLTHLFDCNHLSSIVMLPCALSPPSHRTRVYLSGYQVPSFLTSMNERLWHCLCSVSSLDNHRVHRGRSLLYTPTNLGVILAAGGEDVSASYPLRKYL